MSVLTLSLVGGEVRGAPLELKLRRLVETEKGSDEWRQVETPAQWDPVGTAVIICDMWNQHWCKGATARVAEMAPRMNEVITELRKQGVLIIHCPSGTMKHYEGTPGRKLAQAAPKVPIKTPLQGWCSLDSTKEPPLPIDDSDGGCDDQPQCKMGGPWTHEIDTLKIEPGDAITDSTEAYNLRRQRGITNVIVMGVHQNMCVLGRPFAIRQMVYQGQNVVLMRDMTDSMYNSRRKPYVDHFTGDDLVCWHIEKYWCPTITSDQVLGGEPFRFAADTKPPRVFHNFVKVPKTDGHWKRVSAYVEETPNPDYYQASEAAREAFRDMKFGVRLHWGVYSMLGVDASWPFLGMSNEKRDEYQHLYEKFNPVDFDAEAWMSLFERDGVKVVAFTSKHHDGFSMFDTHTRVHERVNWVAPGGPKIEACDVAYSIMESPFKRDIVKEVTEAAHRHGLKIDLYFSHPDWYDADFRPYNYHPLQVPSSDKLLPEYNEVRGQKNHVLVPDPTPEEVERLLLRHRTQLSELLTQYGKIDMICLDQWFGPALWPQLRETIKYLRTLQPDVMFRCRGIGSYGDYYTPEGFVPGSKENTRMPWMVIYPLAGIWAYQPDAAKYKGGDWIVKNLVDAVAKGGSFMVGIGPDATGKFHPKAIAALDYAGAWLRVNGEAIYATRPRPGDLWKQGENIRFTRSKDNRYVYAICLSWPGTELALASVHARAGSPLVMLGVNEPLSWHNDPQAGLVVEIPQNLQTEANRPCRQAYAFKIEQQTGERAGR